MSTRSEQKETVEYLATKHEVSVQTILELVALRMTLDDVDRLLEFQYSLSSLSAAGNPEHMVSMDVLLTGLTACNNDLDELERVVEQAQKLVKGTSTVAFNDALTDAIGRYGIDPDDFDPDFQPPSDEDMVEEDEEFQAADY